MKGRYLLTICCLAFSITLAVIIGQRLAAETLALIAGVAAGVAASVPTSLLIVWAITRSNGRSAPDGAPPPHIVVMNSQPADAYVSGRGYSAPAYSPPLLSSPPKEIEDAVWPRRFTIIGETESGPRQVAAMAEEDESDFREATWLR